MNVRSVTMGDMRYVNRNGLLARTETIVAERVVDFARDKSLAYYVNDQYLCLIYHYISVKI